MFRCGDNPAAAAVFFALSALPATAQVPEVIATPGATKILEVHAEGAQIYECKPGKDGQPVWQFREPIAALILDGETVGRHYLGPTWEFSDGSAVTGQVASRASGSTPSDIPWLRLNATSHRGEGRLSDVVTIQRLNTKGGVLDGHCEPLGALASITYSSDYVFLK
jgi:hypothetical protein